MILKKPINKLIIMGSALVATTVLSTALVVACSSTSNPTITTSAVFTYTEENVVEKQTISISNDTRITLSPGVSFNKADGTESKLYTSAPGIVDFSKSPIEEQRAFGYFTLMTNFMIWLQGYSYNLQNFLAAAPTKLVEFNPSFKNKNPGDPTPPTYNENIENLAAALSATINEGRDVARLGLREISFDSKFRELVNDDKLLIGYDESKIVTTLPENYITNIVNGIELKFNWWTTGGNDVNWKSDTWDVDLQNTVAFKKYIELGFDAPQPKYSIQIADVSFKWQTKYNKIVDKEEYYPSGIVDIKDPGKAYWFDGLNNEETQEMLTFVTEADKRRVGDIVSSTFYDYVIERPNMVERLLKSLNR